MYSIETQVQKNNNCTFFFSSTYMIALRFIDVFIVREKQTRVYHT